MTRKKKEVLEETVKWDPTLEYLTKQVDDIPDEVFQKTLQFLREQREEYIRKELEIQAGTKPKRGRQKKKPELADVDVGAMSLDEFSDA